MPCRAGPGTTGLVPRHGPFSSVPCRVWAGPNSPCLGPARLARPIWPPIVSTTVLGLAATEFPSAPSLSSLRRSFLFHFPRPDLSVQGRTRSGVAWWRCLTAILIIQRARQALTLRRLSPDDCTSLALSPRRLDAAEGGVLVHVWCSTKWPGR